MPFVHYLGDVLAYAQCWSRKLKLSVGSRTLWTIAAVARVLLFKRAQNCMTFPDSQVQYTSHSQPVLSIRQLIRRDGLTTQNCDTRPGAVQGSSLLCAGAPPDTLLMRNICSILAIGISTRRWICRTVFRQTAQPNYACTPAHLCITTRCEAFGCMPPPTKMSCVGVTSRYFKFPNPDKCLK